MGDRRSSDVEKHSTTDCGCFLYSATKEMKRQLDMDRQWGFKLPFGLTMDKDRSNHRYVYLKNKEAILYHQVTFRSNSQTQMF